MRPVIRGLVRYESLLDGSVNAVDLLDLHAAMDADDESQRRSRVAAERARG